MTRDTMQAYHSDRSRKAFAEPLCGIRLLPGIKTTWVQQGHWVGRKKTNLYPQVRQGWTFWRVFPDKLEEGCSMLPWTAVCAH